MMYNTSFLWVFSYAESIADVYFFQVQVNLMSKSRWLSNLWS